MQVVNHEPTLLSEKAFYSNDSAFQRLARLACVSCSASTSFLVFCQDGRHEVMGAWGFELERLEDVIEILLNYPSDQAICIEDAFQEITLCSNPVIARDGFRFFASAPILNERKTMVGRLVVMDRIPRRISSAIGKPLFDLAWLASLEKQRQKNEAILDYCNEAVIAISFSNEILQWNPRATRLYGWKKEEALGKDLSALIFNAEDTSFADTFSACMQNLEWSGEHEHITAQGEKRLIASRWIMISAIPDIPGDFLILNADITDQKLLEHRLMQSQRVESLGKLAGGLAHDMNNMLTPMLVSIELLQKRVTDERSKRMLRSLDVSARTGAEMLRKLLSYSRGASVEFELVNMVELMQTTKGLLGDLPDNIEYVESIDADLHRIEGDVTQLRQVFLNLIINAKEAMVEGGIIRLKARNITLDENSIEAHSGLESGEYVQIIVSDNGPGISPEFLDRIFDPFFTTKSSGTGLGLSNAIGILKSHHGEVTVQSDIGLGTRFKILLPALFQHQQSMAESEEIGSQHLVQGAGILLVEDKLDILEVNSLFLEDQGFSVYTAENGSIGLDEFIKHRDQIDIVLTDVMMPVMDGYAMVNRLKSIAPEVPVIVASGQISESNFRSKAGVDIEAFLSKPYSPELLLATLNKHLTEVIDYEHGI